MAWFTKTVEFKGLEAELNALTKRGHDVQWLVPVGNLGAVIVSRLAPVDRIPEAPPLDVSYVEVPGPVPDGPQIPLLKKKRGKRP